MSDIKAIMLIALLFASSVGFAQPPDFATILQEKLGSYYRRHIPVKVHITFNQTRYAPGDTAFYHLHFFKADDFSAISGRRILNVHLYDGRGNIVHAAKVLVVDGSGINQIPIPLDATPGRYTVVAYNEVMTEHDASLFYQRPLWVAGPSLMDVTLPPQPVRFYPEGGHLVAGITNKVVVTGPRTSSGKVFSGEGEEVASLRFDDRGLAILIFQPQPGLSYRAVVGGITATLPPAEKDGIGMLVHVPLNKSPIRVTIQIPAESSLSSESLILSMTRHGIVYYTVTGKMQAATFSLPQENIGEGVAQLTVFREDGTVLAERMVFIAGPQPAKAEVSLARETFGTRESIPVKVVVKDGSGAGTQSRLTVTVYHDDRQTPDSHSPRTIVDNAVFYGDVPGTSTDVGEFSLREPNDRTAINNFLITQSWKRFAWDDVWSEKMPVIPFKENLHFKGKAERRNGQPVPDSTRITFFLQQSVMTYVADVDSIGGFDFPLLMDFFGNEEVFYVVEHGGKVLSDVVLVLEPPFPFGINTREVRPQGGLDDFFSFALRRRKIDVSYAFHLRRPVATKPPSLNALIEEEIFGADLAVQLDEYYVFPTMAETLREIVPMLQYRKQRERDVVRLFFDDRDRFAEGEPLFIIDGIITDNTTYFLNLKPADVATIKVVYSQEKLRTFGSIGKNGIVLVETKIPGNSAHVPRSDHSFTINGLQAPSATHRSRHPLKAEWLPDLRTNIYWNPKITTDADGQALVTVPASDVTGRFNIRVEGFTAKGEPVFAEQEFQISFDE